MAAREKPHPPDATPGSAPDRRRRRSGAVRVRERGHVHFFYRPRAGESAGGGSDERLYMVLRPRGGTSSRLLVVAGTRLPSSIGDGKPMVWALVDRLPSRTEEVAQELDLAAGTPGGRGARPAGAGVYAIVHHRGHTHLAHLLDLPVERTEVQRTLNIVAEAAYIVAVANPRAAHPRQLGLATPLGVDFPRRLKLRFRGRAFVPLDPPDFLDHAGAAVLLVATRQQALTALDVRLDPRHEASARAAIFADLRAERSAHPVGPLFPRTCE